MSVKKKLIFSVLFLIGFYFTVLFIDSSSIPTRDISCFSFLINELNYDIAICYYFSIGIVLLISTISIEKNLTCKQVLRHILINSTVVLSIFLICGIICFFINGGNSFVDNNQLFTIDTTHIFSEQKAIIISILLVYLRIVTLSMFEIVFNYIFKDLVGYIFVIFISIIDRWFYEFFNIYNHSWVLPIEHSKIFLYEGVAGLVPDGVIRIPIILSVLYWLLLISGCLLLIYKLHNPKLVLFKKKEIQ